MTSPNARNTAMDLLSRREHSRFELERKLKSRGFDGEEIVAALDALQLENLLNDQRFAESYLHQRMLKGFGPVKIRHEMLERGIAGDIVELQFEAMEGEWNELMRQQRQKKFGSSLPEPYQERMKQARFLQNRGFSPEAVMRLFR